MTAAVAQTVEVPGVLTTSDLAARWQVSEERVQDAAKEAETHQRALSQETDAKLLGEYRANQALAVNEADQAPFRAATASVHDKWEARPFGDFVRKLRAAATAEA